MRLGGPIFDKPADSGQWIESLRNLRYRAAYCPLTSDVDAATVKAYSAAAAKADIVIAEVGAWSNTISPDAAVRREALAKCKKCLDLADRIGATCCVNIVGSRGSTHNGPHPDNMSPATFELIVETVREIIDAVSPSRTFYTLEMMTWGRPDSAEDYLEILRAVDRERFGVHLDVVNIINTPRKYYDNARVIEHTVRTLAPYIKSCHAKDVVMHPKHLVHIDEIRPGLGTLDYATLLRELSRLDADLPLMMEHLSGEEEYAVAAEFIRGAAAKEGVTL
jgi:sugar phosphate isomerase/epimerase